MLSQPIRHDKTAIVSWLVICLLLVAMMVLVGGYTRLSGSGLSITEWKPIHGIVPPLNELQWEEEFASYKASPQYNLINNDMDLPGFKAIFWPEYFHRVLARGISIIFLLPLVVFAVRGSISRRFFFSMLAIFALGGFQGAIGWIMVKSGLQDAPYVNHIKLALHLFIAFIIYALIFLVILSVTHTQAATVTKRKGCIRSYRIWFLLLSIQIIFGAFMAGLHAGLIYNTWPSINGEYLPQELFSSETLKHNLLENRLFVHFVHRTLAVFLAGSFIVWCYRYRDYIGTNNLAIVCALMVVTILGQIMLGVFTLVLAVPLGFALAHQMTALLLWTIALYLLYRMNIIKVI